jgi:hypothetical protein
VVYVNRKQFDGESNLMYRIESNRPAEGGARVDMHPAPPRTLRRKVLENPQNLCAVHRSKQGRTTSCFLGWGGLSDSCR